MVYLQRSLQVINPLNKHLAESVVCCRLLLLPLHLLHHHHRHLFCRSSLSSSAFGIACQHHPGESDNDNRLGHVAMLQTQPALAPNALFAPYTTCCHALYGASFAQPQYAFLLFPLFTTAPACPVKVNNANATRCDPLRFVAMRCLSGLNNLQSRLSMSANHRNKLLLCQSSIAAF